MTYLPHRFSEASVKRFLPVITELIRHPSAEVTVSFDPKELGVSVETAIGRLRDAVNSLCRGLTTFPDINPHLLTSVWSLYKITVSEERVVLVPRAVEKENAPAAIAVGVSEKPTDSFLATLAADAPRFIDCLGAFAVLLGQRVLQGKVKIKGDLPTDLVLKLSSENDIAISKQGTDYIML